MSMNSQLSVEKKLDILRKLNKRKNFTGLKEDKTKPRGDLAEELSSQTRSFTKKCFTLAHWCLRLSEKRSSLRIGDKSLINIFYPFTKRYISLETGSPREENLDNMSHVLDGVLFSMIIYTIKNMPKNDDNVPSLKKSVELRYKDIKEKKKKKKFFNNFSLNFGSSTSKLENLPPNTNLANKLRKLANVKSYETILSEENKKNNRQLISSSSSSPHSNFKGNKHVFSKTDDNDEKSLSPSSNETDIDNHIPIPTDSLEQIFTH